MQAASWILGANFDCARTGAVVVHLGIEWSLQKLKTAAQSCF